MPLFPLSEGQLFTVNDTNFSRIYVYIYFWIIRKAVSTPYMANNH